MQIQKLRHKPPVNMHIKFVIVLKNWKRQLFKRNRLSTIFINVFPKRNRLHFNSVVRCTGVCNFFSLKCKDCLFLSILFTETSWTIRTTGSVWIGPLERTFYILSKYFTHCKEVYRHSNWNTLTFYHKLRLIKLLHIACFYVKHLRLFPTWQINLVLNQSSFFLHIKKKNESRWWYLANIHP